MSFMSKICESSYQDSNAIWNTSSSDFTDCFKNTVLVWTPCSFLWLFSIMEMYFVKNLKFRDTPQISTSILKTILIIFVVVLNFIEIIYYLITDESLIRVLNAILKFSTFILYFFLICMNTKKGIPSSKICSIFLCLSIICGVPQFRNIISEELNSMKHGIEIDDLSFLLYYISIFILFVSYSFSRSKTEYSLCATNRNTCPSHNASFLSKIFLNWYNRYLWENYKKPIETDLWDLDEEDTSAYISTQLEKQITRSVNKMKEKKFSTMKLLLEIYKFPFLLTAFWRLLDTWTILNYPILFSLLISYINDGKSLWKIYLCAIGFAINAILDALILSKHFLGIAKLQIHIRSTLVSIIYKKMLRTSNGARRHYTSGEIINLLINDTDKMVDFTYILHYFWAALFQIIVTFYFIWKAFGYGIIISIILLILLLPVNIFLTNAITKHSNIETKNLDKRGKFIQDLLAGIKVLKMYAWETSFKKKASTMRNEEVTNLKKGGRMVVSLHFLYNCIPPLMSSVSFGAYYYFSGNIIHVAEAFVTVSFFNAFKTPLKLLSYNFQRLTDSFISIERVDRFLNLPELEEEIISHDSIGDVALLMENASFSWISSIGPAILQDLNVKIKKGTLVTIVGPVGCGKSSLISAFLGELHKMSGHVNVNGKVAYVPQQAWILNTTFRDNVMLDRSVDRILYESALKVCALETDLKTFPAGDLSEIGEKGINLSGGQKQRINIARAICCNADIYFFDDSMSAVDFQVSKHIFQHVVGPDGILNEKTRILVTHNTAFLSQSDCVITLEDGRITESGTFHELTAMNTGFSTLLNKSSCDVKDESRFATERSISEENEKIRKNIPENSKLIEKEHVETSTIKKEVLLYFLSTIGISVIVSVLLLNALSQILSVFSRILLTVWPPENNEYNNTNFQPSFIYMYAAFGFAEALFSLTSNVVLLNGLFNASTAIYNQLISSILNWPLWLLDTTPIGRIINRATSDVCVLESVGSKTLLAFLDFGFKFLLVILITCYITPISVLVYTVAFGIVYIVQYFFRSLAHQLQRILSNNKSPLSSFFVETIIGLTSIRANGFHNKFISSLYKKIDLCSSAYYATIVNYRWYALRLESLYGVIVFLLIMFTLQKRNTLDIGILCFTISYAIQWTKEFQWFLSNILEMENAIISAERIKHYIDFPQETHTQRTAVVPSNWPEKGEIEFKDYKLRYRQNDDLVLKGLTFSVKSGEKIGIIGRTGAGKTSLILGLLRLVEPADGIIFIDNLNIREIDLCVLRSRLTIIPQDPVLFLGTLRFNLDPTEIYTDDCLWNALEKSHLKNFVQHLPNGMEYAIEESGGNLSCGQKQLICLARALLRKTKVLILDEATASVDTKTDELIQKTIRQEFSHCTVLTIAHRLNTVQDYDRILVLDNGSVVEFDTPQILLKSKSSTYYNIMLKSGLIKK